MNVFSRLYPIVLLLSCIASAQPKSQFKIDVIDELGAAIGSTHINIHWDPSGSTVGLTDNVGTTKDVVLRTGKTGSVSVEVPPGFYDVFISAPAFTPKCMKVRLKEDVTEAVTVTLKIDPLVNKELGHQYYAPPDR